MRHTVSAVFTTGLVLLGFAAGQAAASPYEDARRGTYLSYVNAPPADGDISVPPKLRMSFGGAPFDVVMDTGSTGILVSAHRIPNIDALPSLGPGELTYTSSGRVMRGRWVVTPVTIAGRDGARATTAPLPVLAVTEIDCLATARNCTRTDDPRGVAMMGIGFGREGDRQAQSGPDKNPFLNIASIAAASGPAEGAADMRRGYIVTRHGVHIGLTSANTSGFDYVPLTRSADGRDWAQVPVCISVNDATPAACGQMLMDTGVSTMFLTVPDAMARAALEPDGHGVTLIPGTNVSINVGSAEDPAAGYAFTVGNAANAMAPERVLFIRRDRAPFVNTSVRFLNGFDYLFDAEAGRAGFRWVGHIPPAMPDEATTGSGAVD